MPDLSEALKQQGNNKISSNYKPETVYYSKGYDVSTLSVNPNLPDLSKEIGNKEAYEFKPSEKVEFVDNSYEVKTHMKDNDDNIKKLMLDKIIRLKSEKNISNYRIYTDLRLNPGNFNAFIKNRNIKKLSLSNTRETLNYLEAI